MIKFSPDQRAHFLSPLREFLFKHPEAYADCAAFVGVNKSTLKRILLGKFKFSFDVYMAIAFIVDHYQSKNFSDNA